MKGGENKVPNEIDNTNNHEEGEDGLKDVLGIDQRGVDLLLTIFEKRVTNCHIMNYGLTPIEVNSLLKSKTFITCKNLIFSNSNSDARAWDDVFITQKGKEAKAQEAFYNDEEETITMNGNVYLKKEGKWVSAQQIIISVNNETFDAIGSVEAEFKI